MTGDFYYCKDCELAYGEPMLADHAEYCDAKLHRINPELIDCSIFDYVKLVNE